MAILKIKDETGKFVDIPAIQGAPGKDGAIQYEAGENITIDGNVISASGGITLDDVKTITGELTDLGTEDKTNLVNAINEVTNSIGSPIETLTNDTIDLAQLNYGVYILAPSVEKIKCGSYSAKTYTIPSSILSKTKILLVGSAGTTYNVGYLFAATKIIYLRSYTDGSGIYSLETSMYSLSQILPKNNTTSYTPTGDYNPATKKYVDDAISSSITTSLEASY